MNGFNRAKEISEIEGNLQNIIQNEDFRKEVLLMLLSGLKTFGFKESLSCLEKESGVALPLGFSEQFKEFVLQGSFDEALGITKNRKAINSKGVLKEENKTDSMKEQITYELLRLKYVKCLLAGDNVTALFLLRNELSKYPKFFSDEKKELSQLFLCKSKKDLIKESGLDVNNKFFLEEFLRDLEQREGEEEIGGNAPFENWIKRYLAYEIMSCDFHRSQSHSLIDLKYFKKSANFKTKKISKKEIKCSSNRERRRRRIKHCCQPKIMDLETKQELKNIEEEVWKVNFSSNGKYIVAATKSNSLFCWKKK
jgi:hypothetical protein